MKFLTTVCDPEHVMDFRRAGKENGVITWEETKIRKKRGGEILALIFRLRGWVLFSALSILISAEHSANMWLGYLWIEDGNF